MAGIKYTNFCPNCPCQKATPHPLADSLTTKRVCKMRVSGGPVPSGGEKIIRQKCKDGHQTAAYLSKLSHREPAWHYAQDLQKLSPSLTRLQQIEAALPLLTFIPGYLDDQPTIFWVNVTC